jgi:hypothetical protein
VTDRLPCCVPFCRRTTLAAPLVAAWGDGAEWICAAHWRNVAPKTKQARASVRRRLKRGDPHHSIEALRALAAGLWAKAKRQAIERAMGI